MTLSAPWRPPLLIPGRPVTSITARQADVLTGLCHGLTNRQIARRLDVSETSVRKHAHGLYQALNARDRCHAVALTASGQVVVHVREARR